MRGLCRARLFLLPRPCKRARCLLDWQRVASCNKSRRQGTAKQPENKYAGRFSVSLWRGAEEGRYETYSVPRRESQTVLDVVTFVQRHIDPTLSYRFACRVGVCGSCAMTVNGKPRWTCRTHVSKVADGGRLEIGPLENLPVIKDLATDMQPFFEKWQQAKGVFEPSKTRHDPIEQIRPDTRRGAPPMRRSNASIAASVMPPAIRCAGTRIISARQR